MEIKLKKYESYKDSGVEWLGEIPEHWEIKRLINIMDFINRGATPIYVEDSKIKIINQATFSKGFFDFNGLKSIDEKCLLGLNFKRSRVLKNDILLASTGGGVLGKIIYIDFENENYFADSHVTIIRGNKCESKFFYYILSISYDLINGVLAQGSTNQTELQRKWLCNFNFPFPPLPEQTAIAKFLDDKTAKIEQAIAQKEKQIELLKERRQILIHKAVTKGINPDVKFKDSGVEWIGEIPEGWEVKRLKYFIKDLESGVSVNASESENAIEGEIGVLKTSCVYKYVFESNENKKVFNSDLKRVNCPVKKNSIIISRMNAPDLVGASGFVEKDYPNLFLPDRLWQTVFNQIDISVGWLSQVIKTIGFRNCISAIANGSSPSMKNISKGDYLNLRVPHPPLKGQIEVFDFIENISNKIATTISLKEQEIEKLKEYKASLINSVVTGKVRVC